MSMQPIIFDGAGGKEAFSLDTHLRVLSVFRTFDGEQNYYGMGWPSIFVRLSGCVGIYCKYCDTSYSWDPRRGRDLTPEDLLVLVKQAQNTDGRYQSDKVTITGGEPLQQDGPAFRKFVELLLDEERAVTVETAGTEDIGWLLDAGVCVVADVKLPSSKARKPMYFENLSRMGPYHTIKMVASDTKDLESAIDHIMLLRDMGCGARICIGPVQGSDMTLGRVTAFINDNQILQHYGVGLNVQLHKLMFPDQFRDEEQTDGAQDFTSEKNKGA
ncbi:MAG: 7-carboxy-7-deazaguanine synthase QueE [Acidimicrobiia bacterium]|nr:7-carboxy-7-deazaguanine synthase QueE [Acidimicrobiia bacterium]